MSWRGMTASASMLVASERIAASMKTSLLLLVFASCAFAQNTAVPVVQTETGAYSVAISPDGKLVATLDQFGRDSSVWELENHHRRQRDTTINATKGNGSCDKLGH